MIISALHLNAFAIYRCMTLVVAVVVLVFFVAGMIMISFSQLAVAEKYAVHNDSHKPNDAGQTVSTRTMMMPATAPITTKTNSIFSDLSINSIPVGKNCAKDMDDRPNPLEYLVYF